MARLVTPRISQEDARESNAVWLLAAEHDPQEQVQNISRRGPPAWGGAPAVDGRERAAQIFVGT